MNYVQLYSGFTLPAIGFGPDSLSSIRGKVKRDTLIHKAQNRFNRVIFDEPKYINAISESIKCGITLIDYSASYGDGTLIAKAIEKASVPREKVIITTRVSNRAQYSGRIEEEIQLQLKGFRREYVDILMFHWPVTDHYEKTWEIMTRFKEKGICKVLGVANCHQHHLERLYEVSGLYPEINQIEIHPLFNQENLINFCKSNDIQVEAYTPTARQDDRLIESSIIKSIAKKHNKNVTQIILRWHYQRGVIPVIRSMNPNHIRNNADIFNFALDEEDMKKINAMNINSRLRYDPDNCDFHSL